MNTLSKVLDDLNQWEQLGKAHPDFNDEIEVPTPEAIATVRKLIELNATLIDKPTFYGPDSHWEIPGGYYIEQFADDNLVKWLRVNSFGNAHLSVFNGAERVLTIRYE